MSFSERRPLWPVFILLIGLLLLPAVLGFVYFRGTQQPDLVEPEAATADPAAIHDFCAKCHAYPDPSSFPRSEWAREVGQAYRFAAEANMIPTAPPQSAVRKYYEERSPLELAKLPELPDSPRWPVKLERRDLKLGAGRTIITSAKLVALAGPPASHLLACDMESQRIFLANYAEGDLTWRVVGKGSFPVRAEVLDLDGDGIMDMLVSNMGTYLPSDDRYGSLVWYRGQRGGEFVPITLLENVGRVVDVKPIDTNGDGKLDLLVSVFGWRKVGDLRLLRNKTTDWSKPKFEAEVIDKRHGSLEIVVADLNKDGKPDFVTAFSQEHEQVVVFFNDGKGGFKPQTVYSAPLPSFGMSAFQLADLDGDGDLDIVLANGDILDPPTLLKPYHGVQWLENTGDGTKFTYHHIGGMYGVMASCVADFDGDGDLDIAAVAYIPAGDILDSVRNRVPSFILYEQTAKGQFTPHVISRGDCDYLSCSAAVLPGDKLPSLIVGNGCFLHKERNLAAVSIWRNRGRP